MCFYPLSGVNRDNTTKEVSVVGFVNNGNDRVCVVPTYDPRDQQNGNRDGVYRLVVGWGCVPTAKKAGIPINRIIIQDECDEDCSVCGGE